MMQASKANESISECSKTGLCITVKVLRSCHEETHDSHLNVTRVQFFRQKSHFKFWLSEIHFQPDPTARNGSVDM